MEKHKKIRAYYLNPSEIKRALYEKCELSLCYATQLLLNLPCQVLLK
jgi:hypothetical protein